MSFWYNSSGQLTNVTETLGRSLTYQYYSDGHLASVQDFIGRSVTFAYSAAGDLVSVTGPAVTGTPTENNFPTGKTTLYSYNGNHQLLTVTAPNEAATGGPSRLAAQYDPITGRLTSLRLGGTTPTGIAAGGTFIYSYLNLAQAEPGDVSTAVFQTTVTNRNGNATRYQFNQFGNILNMVQFTRGLRSTDPPAYANTFTYNQDGEMLLHTYPQLDTEQRIYNSSSTDRFQQGNLLQKNRFPGPLGGDQSGLFTSRTYEANFNFVVTATDASGYATSYGYDAHGNCIGITNPIPSIFESFGYNSSGQMTSHQLPDNGTGWRRTDTLGYYASGAQRGYLQNIVADSGGFNLTNHFDPDAVGNITNTVDALGNNAIFYVNSLNQVVLALSRAVSTSSGSVRYQRATFYDANNNVTNVAVANIDDTGSTVPGLPVINATTRYDILNDPVVRSQTADALTTITTTNHYDANQNPDVVASGEAVNGDQPSNITQTLYDERDRPWKIIRAPNDPAQSTTRFDYTPDREPAMIIQGVEDLETPRVTSFVCDGFGRLKTARDPMGNISTIHYDPNGNRISEEVDGELVDVPGTNSNVRLYAATYAYDPINRQTNKTEAFFNTADQGPMGTGSAVTVTAYNGLSQVVAITDANLNTTVMAYDTAARLSSSTDAKGNSIQYQHDANGNVIVVQETDLSDQGLMSPQVYSTFEYDDQLDRPIKKVDNAGNVERAYYDSRNNRLLEVDARTNATRFYFDGLDRQVQIARNLSGNGLFPDSSNIVTSVVWDNNSRIIAESDGNANTTRYAYDTLNRLILTSFADGSLQQAGTGAVWPLTNRQPTLTTFVSGYDVHDRSTVSVDCNGTRVQCIL